MEKSKRRLRGADFGTDLDSRAIELPGPASIAAGITADVSKERLERYFSPENNTYRVRKEIREMLVFAAHNLIKDPPFTKLDLWSAATC